MGSADIVPGVSGGTIALITGIYTRLIDAIKSFDTIAIGYLLRFRIRDFLAHVHWRFLSSLFTGMMLAILFFTRVIPLPTLVFTHPEPIYGLFFGLIVGSIILLMIDLRPLTTEKWLSLLIGSLIGYWVVTLVPTNTPDALWFIFLSGAVAISAMILPGISGSFILLILGKYTHIFGQFAELGGPNNTTAIQILIVFGIGLIVGIVLFSRFLSWLLHAYPIKTLSVLVGFLVGSLVVIWPWQIRSYKTISTDIHVETSDQRFTDALPNGTDVLLPDYYTLAADTTLNTNGTLIHVRKRIIQSIPILPNEDNTLFLPIMGMITGTLMVLGIGWLGKLKK